MYLTAALLLALGRDADENKARVGLALLVLSGVIVIGFAIAAYGVAAAMPLDVAIDDAGVTFAGALRRWADVTGISRAKRSVTLHAKGGDVALGPGTPATIDALESALRARVDGEGDDGPEISVRSPPG
jgi:hypothetical protein